MLHLFWISWLDWELLHFEQFLLPLLEPVLLILRSHYRLQLSDSVSVQLYADLLGRFTDQARRQIDLERHFRSDLQALRLVVHYGLRSLLSVSLVTPIVLQLDVQVETSLACVRLIAFCVGTGKDALDLIGAPSIVLFAPAQVPLTGGLL